MSQLALPFLSRWHSCLISPRVGGSALTVSDCASGWSSVGLDFRWSRHVMGLRVEVGLKVIY